MIKNYLKIAWRNLKKSKLYSSINISGLAVGMSVGVLIGLWIWDELSFDHYHQNHTRLAKVMGTQVNNGEVVTSDQVVIPLRNELESKHKDLFKQLALTSQIEFLVLSVGEKNISQSGMFVQPEFFSMMTFKILKGNPDALKDPSSMLISQSFSKTMFGNDDPINKVVNVSGRLDVTVAGVYEDLPANSTFASVKCMMSWDKFVTVAGLQNTQAQWGNHSFYLFAEMNDNIDYDRATAIIRNIPAQHMEGSKEEILLHPMDKWYLYNEFKNGKIAGGRIQFVWLFGFIGVFVLLLACINFMNLSTARSEKRSKEVGIRKAIGSLRGQLIGQFLSESLMMAFLSLLFAFALVFLALPIFNNLADKQIAIPLNNFLFWLLIFGFTLITGLIAGSYPALYLSGIRPVEVLKGTFRVGRYASFPRKVLVVIQFTVSIVLIIGTLIVFKQIQYAQDRFAGYNFNGLITLKMHAPESFRNYNAMRDDLLKTGTVENIAESSSPSTQIWNNYGDLDWKGKDPKVNAMFGMIAVTHDFGETIGWNLKEGRNFSRDFPTDSGSFILNEAAVKLTGFKNPVGETMKWKGENRVITGVIKDMVIESPYMPARPTVFFLQYDDWLDIITIKIKPDLSVQKALTMIEPVFKKYNPGSPYEYQFTDEEYAKKFSNEVRIGDLVSLFAVLAVFISCLGLFGLASFVAEQRTKEIGVRKVLGASVLNLWQLLSKEFVMLIVISLLIAIPIASYFMHNWLQNYHYRTGISWWIFVVAGAGALGITFLTVSFQAIKAALANPVKSLRTE